MEMDSKTAADQTASRLKAMILDGDLRPGDALRQDHLARTLNVSRTPLRQAFQILDQQGLVEHEGFRGARVRKITAEVINDLFDMRAALEPLALEAAFERLSKLDFARAEMILDSVPTATTLSEMADLNWRFHFALYAPCGRALLLETIERLCRTAALANVISHSIDVRREASHAEHVELLRICREGDVQEATAFLTHHLNEAHRDIRGSLEE